MRFTEDHEWLSRDGDEVIVGITEHAASQLGDIVFIELPEPGRAVDQGEEIVVIESVKAASDITAPLQGTITAVNEAIAEDPSSVNTDPSAAWFFRMTLANPADYDGLLDAAGYQALIG